jgi:hypothetical protein
MVGSINQKIAVYDGPNINQDPISKITRTKRARGLSFFDSYDQAMCL